jgi:hypothetical protein
MLLGTEPGLYSEHSGIAVGRMSNKENVALQTVNLRLVNVLTKIRKNMLELMRTRLRPICYGILGVLGTLSVLENF